MSVEILGIILALVLFLNQRRLRARGAPVRDHGSFEWQVRYATRAVIAIVLASVTTALWVMAAWADDPKVPTELQDIWCADRLRIDARPEGNCFRFGADHIVVGGTRADGVFVIAGPGHTFQVLYRFADVYYLLDIVKHDDYIVVSDNDAGAPVRYNRGNPYADHYKK
jgi:hypothetical protein